MDGKDLQLPIKALIRSGDTRCGTRQALGVARGPNYATLTDGSALADNSEGAKAAGRPRYSWGQKFGQQK
jgi:hypothetical protein